MATRYVHNRFKFGKTLAIYLVFWMELGCCLYSSNITCHEGFPPGMFIENEVMLMINQTKNDLRFMTLDTSLNKSMLCKVAENIVSEKFGMNTRFARSLDKTRLPEQASQPPDGKLDPSPLPPIPSPNFLHFPLINTLGMPEKNSTTNRTFPNANSTTQPLLKGPLIIGIGPGPDDFLPEDDMELVTSPAMMFAYTLQLLAENAFEERKHECETRQGKYNEELGFCEFKRAGNVTAQAQQQVHGDKNISYFISVIGNSLSLLCLITLLIIYTNFKSLRTRPGKNIMCLSLAMAISQTLQLIALHTIKMPYLCTALGITLHWTNLATFTWMAIISFDLFITFAFPFSSGKFGRKNQFLIYICVSIVIPTVVVGVCVAVDFGLDRVIGYGINICFIGSVWGNLFSYILFVALVMIFNTICLIATITKIHSSQEKSREMKGGDGSAVSDRLQLCLMALKVSTLTALGWIFGVIGGLLGNSPLIYIFLVLTSCQGIFVFLAFCCNKRVYLTVTGQSVDSSQASSSRERKTLLSSVRFKSQHENNARVEATPV